jgi:ribosome-associated protein
MNNEKSQAPTKIYAIRPNKTALKKEHSKVQKLALDLVQKTPLALSKLPLDENLLLQIEVAGQIKGGALKRQVKHIANLLLNIEQEDFEFLLDGENQLIQAASQESKKIQHLCDNLIEQGDDYIAQLIQQNPQLDRQTLRNLMLQAKREKQAAKSNKHQQKLSSYLKQHT